MTGRTLPTALTAAAMLLAAACGGGGDGEGGPASAPVTTDRVEVVDFAFTPRTIGVKAGTTVTWVFNDSAEHTVASTTGGSEIPESPELKDGGTYTHRFEREGTYPYFCTLHNSMTGTVVVTAA